LVERATAVGGGESSGLRRTTPRKPLSSGLELVSSV